MSVLVAGLGQRDRGDDAIGPEVAAEVASRGLPGVTVIQQSDPLALLDVWDGAGLADLVIVIDAIRSGEPPAARCRRGPARARTRSAWPPRSNSPARSAACPRGSSSSGWRPGTSGSASPCRRPSGPRSGPRRRRSPSSCAAAQASDWSVVVPACTDSELDTWPVTCDLAGWAG